MHCGAEEVRAHEEGGTEDGGRGQVRGRRAEEGGVEEEGTQGVVAEEGGAEEGGSEDCRAEEVGAGQDGAEQGKKYNYPPASVVTSYTPSW